MGGDVAGWAYWAKQSKSLAAPLREDVTTIMDIGLMLGALVAASAAGKFAPVWKVPARSLAGAVIGGLLLGVRRAHGLRMQYRRLFQRHPIWQPARLVVAAGGIRRQRAGR